MLADLRFMGIILRPGEVELSTETLWKKIVLWLVLLLASLLWF